MKSSRSSSSEWRCTRRRKPTMRTQAGRCMSWVELFDIIAVVMNASRNSKNNSGSGGGGGSSCSCHSSGGGCCWCWCWCWHWCRFCLAATCCCCVWRRWRGANNNQPVSLVMKPTSSLLRACRKQTSCIDHGARGRFSAAQPRNHGGWPFVQPPVSMRCRCG